MKNVLRLRWDIILLIQLEFEISLQSIAGVTYMDNFDFEERYRNVYECDPFYWHPLHLPEECADMYERLIRSRITKHAPVRVVRERQLPIAYSMNTHFEHPTYEYSPPVIEYRVPDYPEYETRPLSPYERMLALIRQDVEHNPSAPTLAMMPNVGPVAVYRQPISRKSEKMILKMSGAYAKANRRSHGGKYYGEIEVNGAQNENEAETTETPRQESPSDQGNIITLQ